MFVVYTGDNEVLVTTIKKEDAALALWFVRGVRDANDYDRETTDDPAVRIKVDFLTD